MDRQTTLAAVLTSTAIFVMLVRGAEGLVGVIFAIVAAQFAMLIVLTIALAIGLPIRRTPPARVWWTDHRWVSLLIAGVGVLLVGAATLLARHEPWQDVEGFASLSSTPQPVLAIAGALALAFGIAHAWPRGARPATGTSPWVGGGKAEAPQ